MRMRDDKMTVAKLCELMGIQLHWYQKVMLCMIGGVETIKAVSKGRR